MLAILALPSAFSYGGLLEINFTTSIFSTVSGTIEDAQGQFVLDTSLPFAVGPSGAGDVIVSAWYSGPTVGAVADVDSSFTYGLAEFSGDGTPFITFLADGGDQCFTLVLTSDDFFPTDNVFDALMPGLTLDDLNPFNPSLAASTSFGYVPQTDFSLYDGALTSLDIRLVSEVPSPSVLALIFVGLLSWRQIHSRLD